MSAVKAAFGLSTLGLLALAGTAAADTAAANSSWTMGPLTILLFVLVAGLAGGQVARRLHVPSITGNIIAGTILGLTVFRGIDAAGSLAPLSEFAVSLIAVTAGGHFSYRRMHNALRRILFISILQVAGAILLSFILLSALGLHWTVALMLGVLATSSSPATIVAIIREVRAKGPMVKTLLASVSMDSGLCILLFAIAHSIVDAELDPDMTREHGIAAGIQQAFWHLSGSAVLGVFLGLFASRLAKFRRFNGFSFMLIAILLATTFSQLVSLNPLLTCLFFGGVLANSNTATEKQLDALLPVEPMLYTAFFTLAGISLHLDMLVEGGFLFIVYVFARSVGKGLGAYAGSLLSASSSRIQSSIPFAFVPQAGVALGLVVVLQADPRIPDEISSLVVTLTLASITVNEVLGPSITRWSLFRAKEAGLDRPRLVEFLQEEFVLVGLEATDKWDAIEKLVDFYARTHRTSARARNMILDTINKREREYTTAIGRESALPHGWVESGPAIRGVLAVVPDGVDWAAPDGKPVKLVVLIVTPQSQEHRHLEVLASLSAMVSNERLRNRLISANDPNDAWEVLESEESRDFNYFLEDESDSSNERTAH